MIEEIEAQLHFWPWSVEVKSETVNLGDKQTSFPFCGSPVISLSKNAELLLSSRLERFRSFGCPYDNCCQIYETPHGVLAGSAKINYVRIRAAKQVRNFYLTATAVIEKSIKVSTTSEKLIDSPLSTFVVDWSQVFDDLLELTDKKNPDISWPQVVSFLDSLRSKRSETRRAIIVRISQVMRRKLPLIVTSIRRILLRERELIPIHRIQETDGNCLKWFIRQPGETIAEKGGNKQKLLAVTRKSFFNTLENQILKDFIVRCRDEAARYLQGEAYSKLQRMKSSRAVMVQGYKHLCNVLLQDPIFNEISYPAVGVQPNYVLQNDSRYHEIWFWYKKLLRKKYEEDSLWDWQPRLWGDVVRLLTCAAFELFSIKNDNGSMAKDGIHCEPLVDVSFNIRIEQERGARLFPESLPGPFVITVVRNDTKEAKFVLELVHPDQSNEHPLVRHLTRLGGHLYLVLHRLDKPSERKRVIVFWAINGAGVVGGNDAAAMAISAFESLEQHKIILGRRWAEFPLINGVIISSTLQEKTAISFLNNRLKIPVLEISADSSNWRSALDQIVILLNDLLGQNVNK